ncbi:MAG: hypothetical protein CL678_12615 [Bdellovibrionaceae bacterium]|nr:hypothetical protein [Pseudobdellovibrionaceae bacterium]|tara:strand:+ start:8840 stop:9298 length:459 start_codon:yes stop_codon:yes gene_type:complete
MSSRSVPMNKQDQSAIRLNWVTYFGIALFYGLFCSSLFVLFSSNRFQAAQVFIVFWSLCVMDLFFLERLVGTLMQMSQSAHTETRWSYGIQSLVYGLLKLLMLGAIVALLFHYGNKNTQGLPIIFGLGTLVIVPLFGGFLWSQKTLSERRGH